MLSAAAAAVCVVCVCQCVCTCIYLSDQGHTLLWAAQPGGPVGIA